MQQSFTHGCFSGSQLSFRKKQFSGLFKALSIAAVVGLQSPATAQTTNAAPYCQYNTGLPIKGFAGAISKVTLGTLSNTSGLGNIAAYSNINPGATELYTYYNNLTAPTLTAGSNYNIELEFRSTYDGEPRWYAAYIDYNHNNVFDTTTEMIIDMAHANINGYIPMSTNTTIISTTRSNTFTIPATALTGTTRMRVIRSHRDYQWKDSISRVDPCKGYPDVVTASSKWYYGEVEDYNVNIIAPAPAGPAITAIKANPVTTNTAQLNATINAASQALTISFEYGVNANYGNTITPSPATVSGTTNVQVSTPTISGLFPNNTYHYRVKAVGATATYYSADSTFKTLSTTAVGSSFTEEEISIYPNPSQGIINIDLHNTKSEVSIEVFNTTGAVVFRSKEKVNGTKAINLQNLPAGLYNIQVRSGDKQYRKNINLVH